MIRHIVMFTLKASDEAERAADVDGMREKLTALVGQVQGLRSLSFERDLGLIDTHWDVVLVSEHDSNADLEAYQAHPLHKEAGAYIAARVADRATVDYEF